MIMIKLANHKIDEKDLSKIKKIYITYYDASSDKIVSEVKPVVYVNSEWVYYKDGRKGLLQYIRWEFVNLSVSCNICEELIKHNFRRSLSIKDPQDKIKEYNLDATRRRITEETERKNMLIAEKQKQIDKLNKEIQELRNG